jgi:hypothetical protein
LKKIFRFLLKGALALLGFLLIAFIVLKLVGVIAWSWWWVLAPVWIPTAILIVVATIFFTVIFKKS